MAVVVNLVKLTAFWIKLSTL